jgi:hypothetical protein
MADNIELVRDKNVVAVIAFQQSIVYATDAVPGKRPERLVASDPHGHFRKVHHRAGNPDGTYEDDSPEYWHELTEALAPAGAILLLGHGGGKANASHQWVAYAEKHRRDVAAKVVADVRVDIDHLDDTQVLRLAQYYFSGPPALDFGDGRWGELGGSHDRTDRPEPSSGRGYRRRRRDPDRARPGPRRCLR